MPDRSIRIVLLKADAALERRVEADLLDYRDAAFRLSSVDSLDDAFAQVRDASCDVLLLGPEAARAGPEVLRQVMTQAPGLPVVVLTHHDRSYAIAAVRAGAQDCLQDEEIGGGALGHALHFACERARTAAASVAAERAPDLDAGRLAAILVHDLHEPLRVVVEYGRLLELRMQDSLDPSTGQYLRRLRDAGDRMQQILGSLLDYARAGTREPERHPIEVEEILKSALAGVSPGAAVRWDRLPELSVDGVQLVQVFQNLISNAIKFHGEGEPEIEVGASLEGDHWVLWVSDNGPGVAPEEAQHIFEVFHRAGRSDLSQDHRGARRSHLGRAEPERRGLLPLQPARRVAFRSLAAARRPSLPWPRPRRPPRKRRTPIRSAVLGLRPGGGAAGGIR
jgi:signal transduction histidine kinase